MSNSPQFILANQSFLIPRPLKQTHKSSVFSAIFAQLCSRKSSTRSLDKLKRNYVKTISTVFSEGQAAAYAESFGRRPRIIKRLKITVLQDHIPLQQTRRYKKHQRIIQLHCGLRKKSKENGLHYTLHQQSIFFFTLQNLAQTKQ